MIAFASATLLAALLAGQVVQAAGPVNPPVALAQASSEPSRAQERKRLFAALAKASTEADGRAVENEIWLLWHRAPTPEAQAFLDRAMERRQQYDLVGAIEILEDLVEIAPDYAEGWNQIATVRFMQEEFDRSLTAVEKTLELEPKHFGALAGQALILMRQGRFRLAQSALRRAVEIHPWLKERSLLVDVPEEKI